MSYEMCLKMMGDYPPSIAAKKIAGALPDGFVFYAYEWLGDGPNFQVMKVTGGVFREAKRGPNKGKKSIVVKGTVRDFYVTSEQIKNAAKEQKP